VQNPLPTFAKHAGNLQNVVWNSRLLFDDAMVWLPSAMEYLQHVRGMYDELVGQIAVSYASKPELRDAIVLWLVGSMYETQETVYGGVAFAGLRALGLTPDVDVPPVETTPTPEEVRRAEPAESVRLSADEAVRAVETKYPTLFKTLADGVPRETIETEVREQIDALKTEVNEIAAKRRLGSANWRSNLVSALTESKAGPMAIRLGLACAGLAATATILLLVIWGGKSIIFGSSSDAAQEAGLKAAKDEHDRCLATCGGGPECAAGCDKRYADQLEKLGSGSTCPMLSTPYGTVLGMLGGVGVGWTLMRRLAH